MNRSKAKGTRAESAVVRWLQTNGYPDARRRVLTGSVDTGDIDLGILWGVVLQVKAGRAAERASDAQVAVWMRQAEDQALNGGNKVGLLVTKRSGFGDARPGCWWLHYRINPWAPARTRLSHIDAVLSHERVA